MSQKLIVLTISNGKGSGMSLWAAYMAYVARLLGKKVWCDMPKRREYNE